MSTEVRKIEGWSVELDIDPDRFTFYPGGEQPNFPPPQYTVTSAVLVVGSKVAFAEAEVKAMMDAVKVIAAEHSAKCYTNRIEQMTPPAPVAFHIDNYLWKTHGITL